MFSKRILRSRKITDERHAHGRETISIALIRSSDTINPAAELEEARSQSCPY